MVAVTLLAGVNDQPSPRERISGLRGASSRKRVPRLVVDLIPYNPVPGDVFERPGRAAVSAFQQPPRCVRNARGDDELRLRTS